jgi:hypothetical protein
MRVRGVMREGVDREVGVLRERRLMRESVMREGGVKMERRVMRGRYDKGKRIDKGERCV